MDIGVLALGPVVDFLTPSASELADMAFCTGSRDHK